VASAKATAGTAITAATAKEMNFLFMLQALTRDLLGDLKRLALADAEIS